MINTNAFFSFTDKMPSLSRGRAEKILDKRELLQISSPGEEQSKRVFGRRADILVELIFNHNYNKPEQRTITHGMINSRYGKEWGELAKPKTAYALYFCDEKVKYFFDLNKTEFEFCNYIISTFSTIQDIMDYVEDEKQQEVTQ